MGSQAADRATPNTEVVVRQPLAALEEHVPSQLLPWNRPVHAFGGLLRVRFELIFAIELSLAPSTI